MSPRNIKILEVAIVGPMDADQAKDRIIHELRSWNNTAENLLSIQLKPRRYPIDTVPTHRAGLDGQGITNEQIIRNADIVFAVFYHSLGSPTDKSASGTNDEISIATEYGKPCHVYFYSDHEALDNCTDKPSQLEIYRKSLERRNFLVGTWSSPDDWVELVPAAINQDLRDLKLVATGTGNNGSIVKQSDRVRLSQPPFQQQDAGVSDREFDDTATTDKVSVTIECYIAAKRADRQKAKSLAQYLEGSVSSIEGATVDVRSRDFPEYKDTTEFTIARQRIKYTDVFILLVTSEDYFEELGPAVTTELEQWHQRLFSSTRNSNIAPRTWIISTCGVARDIVRWPTWLGEPEVIIDARPSEDDTWPDSLAEWYRNRVMDILIDARAR